MLAVDVLVHHLYGAGFAVQAILSIDLKLFASFSVLNELINFGRAKSELFSVLPFFGSCILLETLGRGFLLALLDHQMNGLIMIVIGP